MRIFQVTEAKWDQYITHSDDDDTSIGRVEKMRKSSKINKYDYDEWKYQNTPDKDDGQRASRITVAVPGWGIFILTGHVFDQERNRSTDRDHMLQLINRLFSKHRDTIKEYHYNRVFYLTDGHLILPVRKEKNRNDVDTYIFMTVIRDKSSKKLEKKKQGELVLREDDSTTTIEEAGKKRKPKDIIDGVIKSLVAKGRTEDEALADLKKQIDKKFYSEDQELLAALVESAPAPQGLNSVQKEIYDRVAEAFEVDDLFEAVQYMRRHDFTLANRPYLKPLFDANKALVAKLPIQEILVGDCLDYMVRPERAWLTVIGFQLPDPDVGRMIDARGAEIKRQFAGMTSERLDMFEWLDVLSMAYELTQWGASTLLPYDLNQYKLEIIKQFIKYYNSPVDRGDLINFIPTLEWLQAIGYDWPELSVFLKRLQGRLSENFPDTPEALYYDMGLGETQTAVPAAQILKYVKQIHPAGEFNIDHVITDHPHWQEADVPVRSLHIFDPEQDDIYDPYNRVQDTDLHHVDRLIPNIASIVQKKPLVIDDKGYILDGNHRALAARKAGLQTVPVWQPVKGQQGVAEGNQPGKPVVDAILKVMPVTQEIWFHGSRATGQHRRNSDTDILVVVPDDLVGDQYLGVVRILQKLSAQFDNYDIQPAKSGTNIHRIAQEEGQLLWSNKQGVADSPLTKFTGKLNEDLGLLDTLNNGNYERAMWNIAFGYIPRSEIAATSRAMQEHKHGIIKQLLTFIKDPANANEDINYYIYSAITGLRGIGINWPELKVIENSVLTDTDLDENFADGKGPGRPGDSQRHGIPKGATIAQLEKAAKAPGRKGQLARWQLNMRRGHKKEESVIDEKWSEKYKRSIDCSHPKGFSQKAHCAGRKKTDESEAQVTAVEAVKAQMSPANVRKTHIGKLSNFLKDDNIADASRFITSSLHRKTLTTDDVDAVFKNQEGRVLALIVYRLKHPQMSTNTIEPCIKSLKRIMSETDWKRTCQEITIQLQPDKNKILSYIMNALRSAGMGWYPHSTAAIYLELLDQLEINWPELAVLHKRIDSINATISTNEDSNNLFNAPVNEMHAPSTPRLETQAEEIKRLVAEEDFSLALGLASLRDTVSEAEDPMIKNIHDLSYDLDNGFYEMVVINLYDYSFDTGSEANLAESILDMYPDFAKRLNQHKQDIIKSIRKLQNEKANVYRRTMLTTAMLVLKYLGINWPELTLISRALDNDTESVYALEEKTGHDIITQFNQNKDIPWLINQLDAMSEEDRINSIGEVWLVLGSMLKHPSPPLYSMAVFVEWLSNNNMPDRAKRLKNGILAKIKKTTGLLLKDRLRALSNVGINWPELDILKKYSKLLGTFSDVITIQDVFEDPTLTTKKRTLLRYLLSRLDSAHGYGLNFQHKLATHIENDINELEELVKWPELVLIKKKAVALKNPVNEANKTKVKIHRTIRQMLENLQTQERLFINPVDWAVNELRKQGYNDQQINTLIEPHMPKIIAWGRALVNGQTVSYLMNWADIKDIGITVPAEIMAQIELKKSEILENCKSQIKESKKNGYTDTWLEPLGRLIGHWPEYAEIRDLAKQFKTDKKTKVPLDQIINTMDRQGHTLQSHPDLAKQIEDQKLRLIKSFIKQYNKTKGLPKQAKQLIKIGFKWPELAVIAKRSNVDEGQLQEKYDDEWTGKPSDYKWRAGAAQQMYKHLSDILAKEADRQFDTMRRIKGWAGSAPLRLLSTGTPEILWDYFDRTTAYVTVGTTRMTFKQFTDLDPSERKLLLMNGPDLATQFIHNSSRQHDIRWLINQLDAMPAENRAPIITEIWPTLSLILKRYRSIDMADLAQFANWLSKNNMDRKGKKLRQAVLKKLENTAPKVIDRYIEALRDGGIDWPELDLAAYIPVIWTFPKLLSLKDVQADRTLAQKKPAIIRDLMSKVTDFKNKLQHQTQPIPNHYNFDRKSIETSISQLQRLVDWPELVLLQRKINELTTNQQNESAVLYEYKLDTDQYGGWITPDRKVEYVERQQHEPHVWTQHGATYSQAFQRGFVRFTTSERTQTFGLEGTAEALKKTYRIWAPTAFSMHTVLIDIALYTDSLYKEGMIPSMTYSMPKDKAEVARLFGPTTATEDTPADNIPMTIDKPIQSGAALTVFDIDETLFHTAAKIHVIKDGKVVDSLDNQRFNNYQLKPGESFDFKQFRDAQLFYDTSKPVKKMWQRAQETLSQIGKRPGSRVIIVTARSDLDDKETFLDTFRKYGLDIDKVHVHRAGNLPIPAAAAKKAIIGKYLESGKFTEARLFDDAESNLRSFLELQDEHPNIKFDAYLVLHSGDVRPYDTKKN